MFLAAVLVAASILPAAPATAGACVHDHPFNGDHGGSPHVHLQCHDNSPGDRPSSKADVHRRDGQHRPAHRQPTACVDATTTPPTVNSGDCTGIPQSILDSQHTGGCNFVAVSDAVAGESQMTGEIDVEAEVFSANPTDNPVSATFTCYIKVNGATQPGAIMAASGTGVVVGGGVVTYTSTSVDDFVQMCEDVSYSNGVNTSECFEADSFEIPPAIVWEIADPLACPVLGLLAPGVPGVVDINSQGDVWLLGDGFYDCMPYGNVFGFPPNG